MKRPYSSVRRAYAPRMWPMLMVGVAIVVPVSLALRGPPWAPYAVGVGVGVAVPTVRWWIWKRQHPPITVEQFLQGRRDAAPWN